MQISGSTDIRAPRGLVLDLLQDGEVLRAAIPGCIGLAIDGEGRMAVVLEVSLGPLQGEYGATLSITAHDDRSGCDVRVAASTGPGTIEGTAVVTLGEDGDSTRVAYEATIVARGAAARPGQRQVEGAADLLARQFLRAFRREVERRVR